MNFMTNHWIEVSKRIESFVKNNGVEKALTFRGIRGNMIQGIEKIYEKDLEYLHQFYNDEQIEKLIKGYIEGEKYNPVHHLYLLQHYIKRKAPLNLLGIKSIIEWGGGYGSLARIIKKIYPDIKYTIIDLPIMNKIQKWYLKDTDVKCITINELEKKRLKTDMMISTWALTECTDEAWNYVKNKEFFKAKHFLFGYLLTWPVSKLLEEEFKKWKGVYIQHMPSMEWFSGSHNPDDQNRFLFI